MEEFSVNGLLALFGVVQSLILFVFPAYRNLASSDKQFWNRGCEKSGPEL